MHVRFVTTADQKYDQFVANHPLGSIHQTRVWGEFQAKTPGRERFWCLVLEDDNGQILASALVIRQALPLKKSWLYCPRGPLVDYQNPAHVEALFNAIKALAAEQKAVFLRFDPALTTKDPPLKIPGSHPSHAQYQPQNTLILDLTGTPELLMTRMKPKGRYNIKIAQKHSVKVRAGSSHEDLAAFYSLLQQTTTRDAFSGHSQKYYQNMLDTLGTHAKLYLAEYDGKTIAGIIVTHFKDTAIYYFGASSNEHRNTMAPYLLQWQAILDAKNAGLTQYDFLGIAPEGAPKSHHWSGVTDFKLKFGGTRVDYQSAQEIIYRPRWYTAIKLAKKIIN